MICVVASLKKLTLTTGSVDLFPEKVLLRKLCSVLCAHLDEHRKPPNGKLVNW